MVVVALAAGGVCLVIGAVAWKLWILRLKKSTLKRQIDDLMTISDSLNRTEGRQARKVLWRDKTVGDLVREMNTLDADEAG